MAAPSVVASATGPTNTTTSVTVNKPTGTSDGHYMLGVVVNEGASTAPTTVPSGWTLRASQVVTGVNHAGDGWVGIYEKVASSEGASYTWSGFTDSCAGGITTFSGVDTSTPVDASGSQTNGNTAAPGTPSVTTKISETLIVEAFGALDNIGVSAYVCATDPTTLTEQFEVQSTGGNDSTVSLATASKTAVGPTGAGSATLAGSRDSGGFLLALRPASDGTQRWERKDFGGAAFADGNGGHSFSYPGGAPNQGDLLVIGASSDTTVSTPSGWSLAVSDVANLGAYVFYKIAGAGESSSVTITTSGNFNTSIRFERWAGAAASSTLDGTGSAHSLSGGYTSGPAAATGTLTATGELALSFICTSGQTAAGAPTNHSFGTNVNNGGTSTSGGSTVNDTAVAVGYWSEAGTTAFNPSTSWTNSQSNVTVLNATFVRSTGGGSTPVSLSDSGAAADTASIAATITLSEAGVGTEALAVDVPRALSDAGAGSDAIAVAIPVTLSETGTAADAVVATAAVPLGETATAAETPSIAATLAQAETGAGSDAIAVAIPASGSDSGSGSEQMAASAAVALADAAAATEALALTALLAAAETGTATDSIAIQVVVVGQRPGVLRTSTGPAAGLTTTTSHVGELTTVVST